VSNQELVSGPLSPFLWESDEMESVENWLGVLMMKAGGAVSKPVRGKSSRGGRFSVKKLTEAGADPRRAAAPRR
jgi:hypothetical protein